MGSDAKRTVLVAKAPEELEDELARAYAALGRAVLLLVKHDLFDEWSRLQQEVSRV